jgi:hypothetical protein
VFIKWIGYLQTKRGAPFAPPDWHALTSENYDLYRANPLEASTIKSRTETTETSMALTNFRKGVKRDVSAYIDFKEDKFWESWKRDLFAKARSHHTQDVLDPTYDGGISDEEKELFALQQEFMYSVFIQHVLTPEGKTIVKQHSDSGNAQKIFQQLLHKYEQSPEARLNAIELRAKLATFIYDDTWKSTTSAFLLSWTDTLYSLELVSDTADLYSEAVKKAMLGAAILHVDKLADISRQERQDIAKGQSPLTFTMYLSLLKSAAAELDKSQPKKPRRHTVNQHERTPGRGAGRGGRGRGRGRSGRGGRGRGRSSREDTKANDSWVPKEIWDQLPDGAKNALNSATKEKSGGGDTTTTIGRSVYIAQQSLADSTISGMPPAVPESTSSASDIRQVLSAARSTPATTPAPAAGQFVTTMDGHKYVQISNHNINYNVSYHQATSHTGTLVDGGASGGFSGNDVRVLETTDKLADVTGIADSVVHDIPIATVAGVLPSQQGPIIGIFHQYAHHGTGRTIHSIQQLESFGIQVFERSKMSAQDNKQCMITPDGYVVAIQIRNGLPYIDMRPPTDLELDTLPTVVFTSDEDWDPSYLDCEIDHNHPTTCLPLKPMLIQG